MFATEHPATINTRSLIERVQTPFYLPGSPSTPPISPPFDPSWTLTAPATRGLGRVNARFNSANEDLLITGGPGQTVLVRQYVIPLLGTGIAVSKDQIYAFGSSILSGSGPIGVTGIGPVTVTAFCQRSSGTGIATLRAVYKIVNQTGGSPAPAGIRTIAVTITANNPVISSAGLFLPSDRFSQFNVAGVVNPFSPNTLIAIASASSATMSRTYPIGSPVLGTRNINLRTFTNFIDSGTVLTNTLVGTTFSDGEASGFSYTTQARESYYLVAELGFSVQTALATVRLRFGDSSGTLVALGESSALSRSSGAILDYIRPRAIIL